MTRAIERSLLLAASPLEVFAALRRPEGLVAWFVDRATAQERGLRLEWDVPGGVASATVEVTDDVPGKRFGFRWGTSGTQVGFYLTAEGAGTRLVLVESGFGEGPWWDLVIEEEAEGWDEALGRLVRLLGPGASRRIAKEALLPGPAERVYAALTDQAALRSWFSRDARFAPVAGASYRFSDPGWAGGVAGRGRVLAVSPPSGLALTWHWDPELPPTELLVVLEPVAGGVRLRLVHSGWGTGAEFNRAFEEIDEGWEDALFLLHRYLVVDE
jgi:uncharacterized protein YndB with AHSA1/START domain